jgi:hypothetical protein
MALPAEHDDIVQRLCAEGVVVAVVKFQSIAAFAACWTGAARIVLPGQCSKP